MRHNLPRERAIFNLLSSFHWGVRVSNTSCASCLHHIMRLYNALDHSVFSVIFHELYVVLNDTWNDRVIKSKTCNFQSANLTLITSSLALLKGWMMKLILSWMGTWVSNIIAYHPEMCRSAIELTKNLYLVWHEKWSFSFKNNNKTATTIKREPFRGILQTFSKLTKLRALCTFDFKNMGQFDTLCRKQSMSLKQNFQPADFEASGGRPNSVIWFISIFSHKGMQKTRYKQRRKWSTIWSKVLEKWLMKCMPPNYTKNRNLKW